MELRDEQLRKAHAGEIWDDRKIRRKHHKSKHPTVPMEDFEKLRMELDQTRIDFVKIDLDTALTMVEIARGAAIGSEKRARNMENARRAYKTVVKFREQIPRSSQELKEIGEKLEILKRALTRLGRTL